jgi:hypothetical protein
MMATGLKRILIVGSVSVRLRSLCGYEHIAYVIIKRVIAYRREEEVGPTPTVPNPIDLVYGYVHVMIVQCDIYIYIYIQNRRRLW